MFRTILNNDVNDSIILKMKKIILPVLGAVILMAGCNKDKIKYDVPTTYSFENVSYSGQTQRLDMTDELVAYMETALTPGTTLDAQHLQDMFENTNNPFSFSSTKQLKDKCFLSEQTLIEAWLDSAAIASTSSSTASNGVAGISTSSDGQKKYLLSANGFDVIEMVEKGLMGAVFYYQSTGVYLTDSKIGSSVDNETVTPGEGTAMQHHWDEAFGYLGAPIDFPTNTSTRYWAKYCASRNTVLTTSAALMDAFILGRAAIVNDDHETKTEQVTLIRDTWEKVAAGTAIHYLNAAKSHLSDDAVRNHELSEAVAFIRALQFNPTKKISSTQIQSALDALGTNLYDVTLAGIDSARNTLASAYELQSVVDQL
jgi:hypothetical protein